MKNDGDEIFLKHVGNNIRRIRKSKGLSMETLAYELKTDLRQVGRIERGEVNTSILSLDKIAKVLNVAICEFFSEEEK